MTMHTKTFSKLLLSCAVATAALLPLHANSASVVSELNIVRPVDGEDGDFIIRLSTAFAVSGCYSLTEPEIKEVDAGAVIYIDVKESQLEMDDSTSYDQFGCDVQSGSGYTDIPMNKNKLHEN